MNVVSHQHEVVCHVEARRLDHQRQDGDAVVVGQKEGVAAGRSGFHGLPGQLAAGTGFALDDDAGAEFVFQLVGEQPRDGMGAAAGRKAHQDADAAAARGLRRQEAAAIVLSA
jgi:hypothetical protein